MASEVKLFSYGTLQLEEIQLATFGRTLDTQTDALVGYAVTMIPINDESVQEQLGLTHYKNISYSGDNGDVVEGSVLTISGAELEQADAYEADAEYERIEVKLMSGVTAWVYLRKETSVFDEL